jgi:hypothetical protein
MSGDVFEPMLDAGRRELEASSREPDWDGVRRAARRLTRRREAARAGMCVVAAALAVTVATPAFGLRGELVQLFSSGEPAPAPVVKGFAELDVAAPHGMATGVVAEETREVMRVRLSTGKVAVLWVAPTHSGGFCMTLSSGAGGCDRDRLGRFSPALSIPGPISPEGVILQAPVLFSGHTFVCGAARLKVRFEDGRVGQTQVLWVSKPIDAGFFIYEVPKAQWEPGHRPAAFVLEGAGGEILLQQDARGFFSMPPSTDPSTGVPSEAITSDAHAVLAITTEHGTREALWVAPRRGGGRCHWLTSNGVPVRTTGCHTAARSPAPTSIGGGLLSGSAPILFVAEVGTDVAKVELQFQDGTVELVRPSEGFVLLEIEARHWQQGHRLKSVLARDSRGQEISRVRFDPEMPGTYPCEKPVDVGGGETACP